MNEDDKMNVCIVVPAVNCPTETFIRAHIEHLPAKVTVVHGRPPRMAGATIISDAWLARARRKVVRQLFRRCKEHEITAGYLKAFRATRSNGVLAEYGPTGVAVMEACRRSRIPLVVHFHGADATSGEFVEKYYCDYRAMFAQAAAIIAVSRAMCDDLHRLGAPKEKIHLVGYGVNCEHFRGAEPAKRPPVFLAVGRLVEKKAPHLTLLAFAQVLRKCPEAKLRIVGDGPLRWICETVVAGLGMEHAVTFLGMQAEEIVREEMLGARCFVQHSVRASNGDCEGTPLAILESCASGVPVVATRHGGIPDVIRHGQTGFLIDEQDVMEMANYMLLLATDPSLAATLGIAARATIEEHFSIDTRIERLWSVLKSSFK